MTLASLLKTLTDGDFFNQDGKEFQSLGLWKSTVVWRLWVLHRTRCKFSDCQVKWLCTTEFVWNEKLPAEGGSLFI